MSAPTPSIMASSTQPTPADTAIVNGPCRMVSSAPVAPPATIAFQLSSVLRTATIVQSIVENTPPHAAN